MAIEIVDFPMKNGWIFHSYVSHYQRVKAAIKPAIDQVISYKNHPQVISIKNCYKSSPGHQL
jgi:archaellum component FlaF (FlaF/FlaG flagellin family)